MMQPLLLGQPHYQFKQMQVEVFILILLLQQDFLHWILILHLM